MEELGADGGLVFCQASGIRTDRSSYYFGHLLFRCGRYFQSWLRLYAALGRHPTTFEQWLTVYLTVPKKRVVAALLNGYPSWPERYLSLSGEITSYGFPKNGDASAMFIKHLVLRVAAENVATMGMDDSHMYDRMKDSIFFEDEDTALSRIEIFDSLTDEERATLESEFSGLIAAVESRVGSYQQEGTRS